ncbi:hypothetical protein EIK77_007611 [Talaromyces pinophilus]|nr:hypothetical protein EIK77_007611 [Talaromyces pinophilus]
MASSRHKDTAELGAPLEVETMNLEDAVKLLNLRSSRSGESWEDSLELVRAFGCLPLGIDQATAYIRRTKVSYKQFLTSFNKRRRFLLDSELPGFWNYTKAVRNEKNNPATECEVRIGVWTTWEMSLALLERSHLGHKTARLLGFSALVNGCNISQSFLEPILEDFVGLKPDRDDFLLNMIADASDLSLVENMFHNSRGACYSIHPLITEWLWRRQAEDSFHKDIQQAVASIASFISSNTHHSQEVDYEVLGHIQSCLRLVHNHGMGDNVKLGKGAFREIGITISDFLSGCNAIENGEEILQTVVSEVYDSPKAPGTELSAELSGALSSLGFLALERGDLKEGTRHFLTVVSACYGQPSFSTIYALKQLCFIYMAQGDLQKAIFQCLEIFSRVPPHFRKDELRMWALLLDGIMRGFYHLLSLPSWTIDSLYKIDSLTAKAARILRSGITLLTAMMTRITPQAESLLSSLIHYHSGLILILSNSRTGALEEFRLSLHTLSRVLPRNLVENSFSIEYQLGLYVAVGTLAQVHFVGSADSYMDIFSDTPAELRDSWMSLTGDIEHSYVPDPVIFFQENPTIIDQIRFMSELDLYSPADIDSILYSFTLLDEYDEPDASYGGQDRPWAEIQHLAAELKLKNKRTSEIIAKVQDGIRIRESICGASDVELLMAKYHLGAHYFRQAEFLQAAKIYREISDAAEGMESTKWMLLSSVHGQARCMLRLKRPEDFNNIKKSFPHLNWQAFEAKEQKLEGIIKDERRKLVDRLFHGRSVEDIISVAETHLGQTQDIESRQLDLYILERGNHLLSSQQEPES